MARLSQTGHWLLLAELAELAVRQQARAARVAALAPMVAAPTLAATAAPLRPVKLGLPLRWLLLQVVGVAVVASPQLLLLPTRGLVA